MPVPYTFAGTPAGTSIPLSDLDANFSALGDAANVSFLQSGAGALTRTVQSKLRDVVSVKDFGAVGNGVANDTTAIQTAVNALAGKSLFFPPGTYIVNAPILVTAGMEIVGCGAQSIIKSVALSANPSYPGQNQFIFDGAINFSVFNIKFDTSLVSVFTASVRCIYITGCSYYKVQGCTFTTCGAAVASLASNNYDIIDNTAIVSATDSVAHHDGVFDNWNGSSYFRMVNNTVIGNSIARYAFLVTGLASDAITSAPCSYFDISNNIAKDIKFVGIWCQGNIGVNNHFTISRNKVYNVLDFHGIRISDSEFFSVSDNIVENVYYNGILFDKEATGTNAARYGTVVGNFVKNANQAGTVSGINGSAIVITSVSQNIHLEANIVAGTTHTYPVLLLTSTANCYVGNGQYNAGTVYPEPFSSGANSNIIINGTYTPTLTNVSNVASSTMNKCVWTRTGSYITVSGQILVTATTTGAMDFGLSLPVASNLAVVAVDCSGVCSSSSNNSGYISADTTNDRARFLINASTTSSTVVAFSFSYIVK